jgi:hypothetical protein
VLPHVKSRETDVVIGFARYFSPRLLLGVEVMKKVFNALFAAALILGLASTLAANAQHGTAPQLVTSNYFGVRPTACVPDGAC